MIKGLNEGNAALVTAAAQVIHDNAADVGGNNIPVTGGTYNPDGLTLAEVLSTAAPVPAVTPAPAAPVDPAPAPASPPVVAAPAPAAQPAPASAPAATEVASAGNDGDTDITHHTEQIHADHSCHHLWA